jgi:hypothetical protein
MPLFSKSVIKLGTELLGVEICPLKILAVAAPITKLPRETARAHQGDNSGNPGVLLNNRPVDKVFVTRQVESRDVLFWMDTTLWVTSCAIQLAILVFCLTIAPSTKSL